MNLVFSKARVYGCEVAQLFTRSNVPFSFDQPWCNALYMNGVITHEEVLGDQNCPATSAASRPRSFSNGSTPGSGRRAG